MIGILIGSPDSVVGIALAADEYFGFVQCFFLHCLDDCACYHNPASHVIRVEFVEGFIYLLCERDILHLNAGVL